MTILLPEEALHRRRLARAWAAQNIFAKPTKILSHTAPKDCHVDAPGGVYTQDLSSFQSGPARNPGQARQNLLRSRAMALSTRYVTRDGERARGKSNAPGTVRNSGASESSAGAPLCHNDCGQLVREPMPLSPGPHSRPHSCAGPPALGKQCAQCRGRRARRGTLRSGRRRAAARTRQNA